MGREKKRPNWQEKPHQNFKQHMHHPLTYKQKDFHAIHEDGEINKQQAKLKRVGGEKKSFLSPTKYL